MENYISSAELVKDLGIKETTLRYLVRQGEISASLKLSNGMFLWKKTGPEYEQIVRLIERRKEIKQ